MSRFATSLADEEALLFSGQLDVFDAETSMSQLHGSFTESQHPRDPKGTSTGGQFTSKEGDGGKPSDDPTKMGLIALYKRTIMLRKKYKETYDHAERALLKQKLVQTLELQRDGYAAKGNVNGVERVKAQLSKLGVKQTASAPASFYKSNPLPTPQQVAVEQKEHLLKTIGGPPDKPLSKADLTPLSAPQTTKTAAELGKYTPEETSVYNNLSHVVESPASVMKFAKSKMKAASGLSLTDTAAVAAYSTNGYRKINAALRAGAMQEEHWGYVNNLNNALEKLPKHVGTVFRKADLKDAVLDLYKPGMIIEERGFTSTASMPGVWSGSTRYEIQSKTGRKISHISAHPSENEVLFKSGTRFRVKNVVQKTGTYHEGGNHRIIHMEEV